MWIGRLKKLDKSGHQWTALDKMDKIEYGQNWRWTKSNMDKIEHGQNWPTWIKSIMDKSWTIWTNNLLSKWQVRCLCFNFQVSNFLKVGKLKNILNISPTLKSNVMQTRHIIMINGHDLHSSRNLIIVIVQEWEE